MQEPHGEGLASHTGPESCAGGRQAVGEALTGEDAGQPWSSEITAIRMPTPLTGGQGHTPGGDRRVAERSCGVADPCLRGRSMHGNREVPSPPAVDGTSGRPQKAMSRTSGTHGDGKSDGRMVPEKSSTKGAAGPAETVEGRRVAKGNSHQTATLRTQRRDGVSPGLGRVREAARRDRSQHALPRRAPEARAVCGHAAHTDLCGGAPGNRRPCRDPILATSTWPK